METRAIFGQHVRILSAKRLGTGENRGLTH